MTRLLRPMATLAGLLLLWQLVVWLTGVPRYILPAPFAVAQALVGRADLLLHHAGITLLEIALGFLLGGVLGAGSAILIGFSARARRWLMPVIVVSQAIPVFALAPLLVLWLGYGLTSKVVMACLVIYFPVAVALFDGLRRTERGWIDLGRTLLAGHAAPARTRWMLLRHIRLPAALPALGSGLRVAAAVAPIGAVIGEWVGSSAGLGYLMLHANARMQVDLTFAALLLLALMAVALYALVDVALKRLIPWQPDMHPTEESL
jgi:putative hydroxymethylpyrimidine transport system permease protein